MGKFNFPWEFTPLFLIISLATCKQVKSEVALNIQHCGNGFPCVRLNTGTFLLKLF